MCLWKSVLGTTVIVVRCKKAYWEAGEHSTIQPNWVTLFWLVYGPFRPLIFVSYVTIMQWYETGKDGGYSGESLIHAQSRDLVLVMNLWLAIPRASKSCLSSSGIHNWILSYPLIIGICNFKGQSVSSNSDCVCIQHTGSYFAISQETLQKCFCLKHNLFISEYNNL